MSKQEFIDKLRLALSGKVSAGLVEENVSYYEEYINTQVRMGKSQEQVLETLGDPRLIAKSIITANEGAVSEGADGTMAEEYDTDYRAKRRQERLLRIVRMPGWAVLLLVVLLLLVVISIVGSIISALLPVLLPIILVMFFVKLFRDWLD